MTGRRDSGGGDGGSSSSLLERLPNSIIVEILQTLDLESLSSAACVCRTFRSSVSQVLSSSFPVLDLSFFSPDALTLNHIRYGLGALRSVTLDCLRLEDLAASNFLGHGIEELNLLKCSLLSNHIIASIGQSCPNLRGLVLELVSIGSLTLFTRNLKHMLNNCSYLEFVCIKVKGTVLDAYGFCSIEQSLPQTVKVLKLKPIFSEDAIRIVKKLTNDRNVIVPFSRSFPCLALESISFLVDYISDALIISITNSLPHLIELHLEDRPIMEPQSGQDLTNHGLQSLGACQNLTGLSLVRSRQHHSVSFKRVNDMGMLLLSEFCKGLQSVKLGGFSVVSDAGFAAILHSCRNLKKFEVRNAPLLSDLAFHGIDDTSCSLLDVKLWSCSLITSETVNKLASCTKLEVLDLPGCKSIADGCLSSISSLRNLTTLNLSGADVTDSGMAIIGRGNTPIANLCVRGCKRISDKGVALIFNSGGIISKTLTTLDIGYIPGVTDEAVFAIAAFALNVIELCMRDCFFVTGVSLKALGSERMIEVGKKPIRMLDLYHCLGLKSEYVESLKKGSFRGLRWLGIGGTWWDKKRENELTRICEERPWLTVCWEGCEMGCTDGWQFHKADDF